MSEDKRWQFELGEYIRQGEPQRIEKSRAWQTAIGLQDNIRRVNGKRNGKWEVLIDIS